MPSSKKVTFGCFKIAENFWFFIFCTRPTSDESQSKTQFNLQSLGENKTGYSVENIRFVSTDENLKKSPHLFTSLLIYSFLIMYCYAKQCYSSLPISYHFLLCCCYQA